MKIDFIRILFEKETHIYSYRHTERGAQTDR